MDKLQLAVNHALAVNSAAIERARQLAANPMGLGMDAKRSQAWCEYGWKEKIEFQDLHNAYKRGGLAFGAVTKLVGKCWGTMPWIIEGEEQQDLTVELEDGWKCVFFARHPGCFCCFLGLFVSLPGTFRQICAFLQK